LSDSLRLRQRLARMCQDVLLLNAVGTTQPDFRSSARNSGCTGGQMRQK
jgi:hypothetical protein